MKLWTGTSGFSYKEWLGSFYPNGLHADEMLKYYATKLSAVEINNTFYRFPKKSVLESWAAQVPPEFRFVLKAPMKITHRMRLKSTEQEVSYLCESASVLGSKLGPILFQLPPSLKKDEESLELFLASLPKGTRAAFEFRHPSWNSENVYAMLRRHNCAWCVSDMEDAPDDPKVISTADFGYVRLRRENYQPTDLQKWKADFAKMDWKEAFVFFKHEDGAIGPHLAATFAVDNVNGVHQKK